MNPMQVKVNGEKADLESGLNLLQLLQHYKLKMEMVVVELNRLVPSKAEYASIILKDGDEVEIVKFLGGG